MKSTVLLAMSIMFLLSTSIGRMHAVPAPGATSDSEPKIIKLTNQVYRIMFPYRLRTNTGVFIGREGILVIDPGFKEMAAHLKHTVQKLSNAPLRFLLNTHPHGDHSAGNVIMNPDTRLINFTSLGSLTADGIMTKHNSKKSCRFGYFSHYYKLHLNGEEIRIYPAIGTHSSQDIITHFVRNKVVFMGDLLLSQSFPAVSKKIKDYLKLISDAIDCFPDDAIFVSGHGKDLDKKGLKTYQEMLLTTRKLVRQAIARGLSTKQIKQKQVLKAYRHYNDYLDWLTTDFWVDVVTKHMND